jgi:hypothetical protein
MADQPNGSAPAAPIEDTSRRWLTYAVVVISIAGVIGLSIVVLLSKQTGNLDTAKFVFSAVLPLLATWVGTILAYYFSKENFMAATQSVTELARTVTSAEKLKAIPVKDKMRPLAMIAYEQVKPGDEDGKSLTDLLKKYANLERIPILDSSLSIRFLIYKSMIDKYLSRIAQGVAALPAGKSATTLTLKDLLDSDPSLKFLFENSFGFVALSATLADAKRVMDQIDKCSDVFVTQNGTKSEAIIGWITDNTITENAKL